MSNAVLDRLKANNLGQFGTFTVANSVAVIPVPDGSIMVIYAIRWYNFADLPDATDFNSDSLLVSQYNWHQMKVYSKKGGSYFQFRGDWDLIINPQTGDAYQVPKGYSDTPCWLVQNEDVRVEISRIASTNFVNNIDRIPSEGVPFIAPPGGYGTQGTTPLGIPTVYYIDDVVTLWQYQPLGPRTFDQEPREQANNFNMPVQAGNTALNPPTWSIPFGNKTAPCVVFSYVLVNKIQDLTVSGSL
jgi:hypothetical protein